MATDGPRVTYLAANHLTIAQMTLMIYQNKMRMLFGLGVVLLAGAVQHTCLRAETPTATVSEFATLPSGEVVRQFTLRNSHGLQVKVIEFGAIINEISAPDRNGKFGNVVLGADSLETYLKGFPAASIIGRYANRIRDGRFTLDGKVVQLSKNAGEHHIHGGAKHYGKLLWKGHQSDNANGASVKLQYTSHDGEEGFPGSVDVSVEYTLTNKNELKIHYNASTDQPTVLNLTNHAYFNLAGAGSSVLEHELQIEADQMTLVDKSLIPTGEMANVEGTPLDFRTPHAIGERISQLYGASNGTFRGYDHNFVLRGESGTLRLAARVSDPKSGRVMECLTTEPGMQLFTANSFNGNPFPKHGGVCLETQHFPDSPNHPEFPSVVLRPNSLWTSTTVYRFSIQSR